MMKRGGGMTEEIRGSEGGERGFGGGNDAL